VSGRRQFVSGGEGRASRRRATVRQMSPADRREKAAAILAEGLLDLLDGMEHIRTDEVEHDTAESKLDGGVR